MSAKDAVATMGTILTDDVGGRDAVHVAVIAVTATTRLRPGDHVGIVGTATAGELGATPAAAELIGIVDPFISDSLRKGQRFWLYLYPRTITSLSHKWTHPAFPDDVAPTNGTYAAPAEKLVAEQWIREFVSEYEVSYEDFIRAATSAAESGYGSTGGDHHSIDFDPEYIRIGGSDASGNVPMELFDHLEVIVGRRFRHRPPYFSCSC